MTSMPSSSTATCNATVWTPGPFRASSVELRPVRSPHFKEVHYSFGDLFEAVAEARVRETELKANRVSGRDGFVIGGLDGVEALP